MTSAHIGGVPVEEALLGLGGPAAIYLAAVAVSMRGARRRLLRRIRR
jgi:hypothetical protein